VPAPEFRHHRQHLSAIQRAALAAADPGACLKRSLRLAEDSLCVAGTPFPLESDGRIYVVAVGKASVAMCAAAAEILGHRLTAGVAAVPTSTQAGPPQRIEYIPAGHPLPDRGSLAAARAANRLLAATRPSDLVLALISGGGSAMFELPRPPVSLTDLRLLSRLLLRSGAPIQAFNTVRRALSQVKAGGLARMAAPAQVVGLVLSDVVGDRLASVASGPTVVGRASTDQARQVLADLSLWKRAPASVRAALGSKPPATRRTPRPYNVIIGSNRMMIEAAAVEARARGFHPSVVTDRMTGEASLVGRTIAGRLLKARPPACLLMGGETTVTIRKGGKGGRNQELALSAAIALDGRPWVALMALASDGVDGPTDAAGAIVTGRTFTKAKKAGWDPTQCLAAHDAYPLLARISALVHTGPTGTNLNDLVVGLVYPRTN
jgi:glycerate 2-kinase